MAFRLLLLDPISTGMIRTALLLLRGNGSYQPSNRQSLPLPVTVSNRKRFPKWPSFGGTESFPWCCPSLCSDILVHDSDTRA